MKKVISSQGKLQSEIFLKIISKVDQFSTDQTREVEKN